jgi:hypothetical protein
VNLPQQLRIGRPSDLAPLGLGKTTLMANATVARAEPMRRVFRQERSPAVKALSGLVPPPVLPAAVSFEGRRAVWTNNSKILEPVVICDTVDVIQDE